MRISKEGEYALRAMIYLSLRHGKGPMRIREISSAEKIPEKFLQGILLGLRKAGLLRSVRGRRGGYLLNRPPGTITLARVIRMVDGPLAPLRCTSRWAHVRCPEEERCGLHRVMMEVRNAVADILEGVSFADMCGSAGRGSKGRAVRGTRNVSGKAHQRRVLT
jgi:Rrf2 family protein